MIFSSVYFIFLFLPLVLLLYFGLDDKWKNPVLLLGSLIFYAYGEPRFVFVLMASVLVNYLLALLAGHFNEKSGQGNKKTKLILICAVIGNTGLLFVYKYLGFAVSLINSVSGGKLTPVSILLPIGISFFTFQALSYVIDVCRGGEPRKNIIELALYICFFPQLIAGPIVRYHDISGQLKQRKVSLELFGQGAERFLVGVSKKVLIANQLAVTVDELFGAEAVSTGQAWIGAICFSLQIYYDFSGYSDMAIGLGKMFGFNFLENFDHPYTAGTITGFWRKWHMSLSGWFRDYVYIPLGGSRCSAARCIFNLFIVWLLTGLWHGANLTFLFWGLLYFVFLVAEKYLIKPEKRKSRAFCVIYRIFTLAVVNFLWVLFRADTLTEGLGFIAAMLGCGQGAAVGPDWYVVLLRENWAFLLAAVIFAMPLRSRLTQRLKDNAVWQIAYPVVLMALFMWSVSFLILGAHNPFLYFNF